jgi:hypothetical protein
MNNKIITTTAVILNLAQVIFVIYFIFIYSTDNMPLFLFLLAVAFANLSAIIFNNYKHYR